MSLLAKIKHLLSPHRKHWFCIDKRMFPAPLEREKWYTISVVVKKDKSKKLVLDNMSVSQVKLEKKK